MTSTKIYTLSLHDALPICGVARRMRPLAGKASMTTSNAGWRSSAQARSRLHHLERLISRSEEHTSELQSLAYLVCRLLLEKKNSDESMSHAVSYLCSFYGQ